MQPGDRGQRQLGRRVVVPMLAALAAFFVSLTLAACGGGEASKSGSEILADSLSAYKGAHGFRVQGHFSQQGKGYELDVRILRPESVLGTVAVDGTSAELLRVGGKAYVRGSAYIQKVSGDRAARLAAGHWIVAPTEDLSFALGRLASPGGIWQAVTQGRSNPDKQGQMQLDGVNVIKLSDSSVNLYVALDGTPFPVRVEGKGDTSDPAGIANVSLDFTRYNESVQILPPADVIDFNDPSTLPAHFVGESFKILPDCGNWGCAVTAMVRNEGGPGRGKIVFHVKRQSDGVELARCNSPISQMAYGGSRSSGCWAFSPQLQQYFNTTMIPRLYVTVDIQNPDQ